MLKQYKSSYARTRAQAAEVYGLPAELGKEACDKEGYEYLMKKFVDIEYTTVDQMDWIPLAASLCRNTLMRRSFSAITAFDMFRMKSDHKVVLYPRDKGDQSGKKKNPRAIYSNPKNPWYVKNIY